PLLGAPDAAAAGRHPPQPVVRRHGLKTLAAQLLPRLESNITVLAIAAAVASARRMIDAIERCEDFERRIDAAAYFDYWTKAAAGAARTAGIRTQLLAPENQRRLR